MEAILCRPMLGIMSIVCVLCKECLSKLDRVSGRKSAIRVITAS